MSEASKINDPNFALQVAVGPPFPELVTQDPKNGLRLAGRYEKEARRFIFKKAHLNNADYRIYDGKSGKLMCCSHHFGKNPYGELDPLGLGANNQPLGEWESMCRISGYNGMPSLRVRPKNLSAHGRQFVQDVKGDKTFFSIAKISRLKTMNVRHNLEVTEGDHGDRVYSILLDLMGRTIQIVNTKEEQVAYIQKSTKALIMNATLGGGSEMLIDVAPGVDWTTILAIVLGMQQVGEHFVKDAASNFVVQPLTGAATDAALEATGLGGVAAMYTSGVGDVTHLAKQAQKAQQMYNTFFR